MLGRVSEHYRRFEITRPDYLADDHLSCIEREAARLWRSREAHDASQTLSDIKCLVESIVRITLDIAGTLADPTDLLTAWSTEPTSSYPDSPVTSSRTKRCSGDRHPGEQDRRQPRRHQK